MAIDVPQNVCFIFNLMSLPRALSQKGTGLETQDNENDSATKVILQFYLFIAILNFGRLKFNRDPLVTLP